MRFVSPDLEFAYDQIRKGVENSNYHAQIRHGAWTQPVIRLGLHDPPSRSHAFTLIKRKRGWFIAADGSAYFSIPPSEDVLQICLNILSQLKQSSSKSAVQCVRSFLQLTEVPVHQWRPEDAAECRCRWKRYGWTVLSREKSIEAWATFDKWFEKHVTPEGIKIPGCSYSQTWDLNFIWEWPLDVDINVLEAPITLELLSILKTCSQTGFPLTVLDRNHQNYLFDPRLGKSVATRNYWAVPILPLDNDYFFISQCYSYGILGLYRPKRLIVFGDKMHTLEGKISEILEKTKLSI